MKNTRTQNKYRHTDIKNNRDIVYGDFDYRKGYFTKYRGIFGYLYICSQCFKPLIDKTSIEVDHIVPPSRFTKKKKKWFKFTGEISATFRSRILNNTFNCVTICSTCNKKKGNRIDHRVLKGIAVKLVEVSLSLTQWTLAAALFMSLVIVRLPFRKSSRKKTKRGVR